MQKPSWQVVSMVSIVGDLPGTALALAISLSCSGIGSGMRVTAAFLCPVRWPSLFPLLTRTQRLRVGTQLGVLKHVSF